MISDALAQVPTNLVPEIGEHVEFLMLVIQGLFTVVLAGVGWGLKMLFGGMKEMQTTLHDIHKEMIEHYATKKELSERVHGLRDQMWTHHTWIHLMAHQLKLHLPTDGASRTDRRQG